jgi:Ca2+-binding RTX toxin-like protein
MMAASSALVVTASGLVLALPLLPAVTNAAWAEPAMCAGQVVTIDLNQSGGPNADWNDSNVVLGTPGDDYINSGGGDDVVCGGAGDDDLYGGEGDDTLLGGAGNDLLWLRGYEFPTDTVQEAYGGPGDDYFNSSPDDEKFVGGRGRDQVTFNFSCRECGVIYDDPWVGVRVDLRLTEPQDTGGRGVDQLIGIEELSGTGSDDVLLGDGEKNYLDGFYGDDVVNGRRGADLLRGGDGTDRCIGGPGHDKYQRCE